MKREAAIVQLSKIMKKVEELGESEDLKQVFIFGSFSRGAKEPVDIDVFLLFESTEWIRYTKREKELARKFGARLSNVDLVICGSKEFNESYNYLFTKDELTSIWTPNNRNWREVIDSINSLDEIPRKQKKFLQYKLFKMYPSTMVRLEYAISKKMIVIKEEKSEAYFRENEKWLIEEIAYYDDGTTEKEIIDEYKELHEYLGKLSKNGVKKEYINTLKLMYIFAHDKNHFFDCYYEERVIDYGREYRTHYYAENDKILYLIYNPDWENVFFHFRRSKKILEIILIPWYRKKRRENYIYIVKRGPNFRKRYFDSMGKIRY